MREEEEQKNKVKRSFIFQETLNVSPHFTQVFPVLLTAPIDPTFRTFSPLLPGPAIVTPFITSV